MIAVENLHLSQGHFHLENITLTIPTGQYAVLMGRTGCGKTTVLEAVAGLRKPLSGRVLLDHRDVTRLPPASRGVGYVPQDAALFKTMTIRDQLGFALSIRGREQPEIEGRVNELADWLGLKHLLPRRPQGLSGGEAQRVALGRALAFQPHFLLLDEPLSSLDEETRTQLIELLASLRNQRTVTVLHVTHNSHEADSLADLRLRLDDGRVRIVE